MSIYNNNLSSSFSLSPLRVRARVLPRVCARGQGVKEEREPRPLYAASHPSAPVLSVCRQSSTWPPVPTAARRDPTRSNTGKGLSAGLLWWTTLCRPTLSHDTRLPDTVPRHPAAPHCRTTHCRPTLCDDTRLHDTVPPHSAAPHSATTLCRTTLCHHTLLPHTVARHSAAPHSATTLGCPVLAPRRPRSHTAIATA